MEIAWNWLRYQPDSELSRWFYTRFGRGSSRQRRIGIVALARKLLGWEPTVELKTGLIRTIEYFDATLGGRSQPA